MTRSTTEPSNDAQVDAAIAEYLESVDRGEHVDVREFLGRYGDLAAQIEEFLIAAELIEELVQQPAEFRAGNWAGDTAAELNEDETTLVAPFVSKFNAYDLEPTVHRKFGRYSIVRPLGNGAMGSVYLAYDTSLERLVALKIPRIETHHATKAIDRFHREARALAQLHHPHICPIYDVGMVGNVPFLSMAFIDGQTLAEYLKSHQPLALSRVLEIVRKLALALSEAHEHGILHRDLKPANIMLDGKGEPIVTDFGLAVRSDARDSLLTEPGMLVGTMPYMAPEQIEAEGEQARPTSDIYSLGILFYQLLTGHLPFRGSWMSIAIQLREGKAVVPSLIRQELANFPEIEQLCLQMMAKRVDDRVPTMRDVAERMARLEHALQERSALAEPRTPLQPVISTKSHEVTPSIKPRTSHPPIRHKLRRYGLATVGGILCTSASLMLLSVLSENSEKESAIQLPAAETHVSRQTAEVHSSTQELNTTDVIPVATPEASPQADEKDEGGSQVPVAATFAIVGGVMEILNKTSGTENQAIPIATAAAVAGEPFGVATLDFMVPERTDVSMRPDQFLNVIGGGRVYYPSFAFESERSQPHGVAQLKRVVAHFLITGSEPLTVKLTLDDRVLASADVVIDPAGDHRELLAKWWQAYTKPPSEALCEDACHLQDYLNAMLARRLNLPFAEKLKPVADDASQLQIAFESAIEYGLGFQSVKTMIAPSFSQPADPTADTLTETLPPGLPLASVPIPAIPQSVAIESIAYRIPQDCLYLRCQSLSNYQWFRRILLGWGGSMEDVVSSRTHDFGTRENVEMQLALSPDVPLDANAVSDLALIASDPYFRDGAGVGIVIQARKERRHDVTRWIMQQRDAACVTGEISATFVTIAGHELSLLSSKDETGRVRSYFVEEEDYFLVTNSQQMVEQFLLLSQTGNASSLGKLQEFRYARHKVRVDNDHVFLYMSDPFFRRLASPEYQIELMRRTRAKADLAHLAYARLAAEGEGGVVKQVDDLKRQNFLPASFTRRADGSRAVLVGDQVYDSLRGAVGFFRPIADMHVTSATRTEVTAYEWYKQRYQREWRLMDPVAVVVRHEPLSDGRESVRIGITITPYAQRKYAVLRQYLAPPTGQRFSQHDQDLLSIDAVMKTGQGTHFKAYAGVRGTKLDWEMTDGDIVLPDFEHGSYASNFSYLAFSQRDNECLYTVMTVTNGLGMSDYNISGLRVISGMAKKLVKIPVFLVSPFRKEPRSDRVPTKLETGHYIFARNESLKGTILAEEWEASQAQVRLRLKEIAGTDIDPYIQAYTFLQARRASARQATLLNRAMQQLHLPPADVGRALGAVHGGKLLCPLDVEFQLQGDADVAYFWTSSGWGTRSYYDEVAPTAEYRFPFLDWLRKLDLDFHLQAQTLTADVHLEVQP